MTIALIAAVAENGAIGKDNDLIWHLPDDMAFFKKQTAGCPVIMGRKNYDSIPERFRPLPGRTNIVVTRQDIELDGAIVTNSLDEAIAVAQGEEQDIYIVGGGEIYRIALEEDLCDTMFITEVHQAFPDADVFFPKWDKSKWTEKKREHHPADEKHAYSFDFVTYVRNS